MPFKRTHSFLKSVRGHNIFNKSWFFWSLSIIP